MGTRGFAWTFLFVFACVTSCRILKYLRSTTDKLAIVIMGFVA